MAILIKKYKNRRLYDTEKSQYITIEILRNYINQGILFYVEDADNHKDITNNILLQILVEIENTATKFLSAEILRLLIILAQHPLSQSYQKILEMQFTWLKNSGQSN